MKLDISHISPAQPEPFIKPTKKVSEPLSELLKQEPGSSPKQTTEKDTILIITFKLPIHLERDRHG